jgi:hypothetical protein
MARVGFQEAGWGTAPEAKITAQPTLTPEQQSALKDLIAQIKSPTNTAGQPYGGALTAEQNAAQRMSLSALEQAAMNLAAPKADSGRAKASGI